MRQLTEKEKIEVVMLCKGEKWSQFCNRNGIHYGRANDELASGELHPNTREKINNAVGFEIKTGLELIDKVESLRTKIQIALKIQGNKDQKWLAREFGTSEQYLSQKITSENFSREDWQKLGRILGLKADMYFVFEDEDGSETTMI